MSIPDYKKQYLITGSGRVRCLGLKTYELDKKFAVAKSLNRLRDGGFECANSLLDWEMGSIAPIINTTTKYAGNGSVKFAAASGATCSMTKNLPCKPGDLLLVSFYIKTLNLVSTGKSFYLDVAVWIDEMFVDVI